MDRGFLSWANLLTSLDSLLTPVQSLNLLLWWPFLWRAQLAVCDKEILGLRGECQSDFCSSSSENWRVKDDSVNDAFSQSMSSGYVYLESRLAPLLCCPWCMWQPMLITQLIQKNNFLSCMQRPGGINFNPRVIDGYRPKASCETLIDEIQLGQAISKGRQFFQNFIFLQSHPHFF